MSHALTRLLSLPRRGKQLLALSTDTALCVLTVWLSICLRFESWISLVDWQWFPVLLSPILAIPIFIRTGLYRAIFRYGGNQSLAAIVQAIAIYGLIFAALFTAIGFPLVPRTIGLIQPILLLVAIGASRWMAQYIFLPERPDAGEGQDSQRALIYGTGLPAQQLALSLKSQSNIVVMGFVDDDALLAGGQIQRLTVYSTAQLAQVCEQHSIRHMLLAKPQLTRSQRNSVLQELSPLNVTIRTLPSIDQWAGNNDHQADQLRQLDIEDLLGRDPVPPDPALMERNLKNQCVLVTGAGGSIGSELARQAIQLGASKLVLFDSSEFALYAIEEELRSIKSRHGLSTTLAPVLGNCCDLNDLHHCFDTHRPSTVFHAAAYKHVPLVEFNMQVGMRNNILGTHQMAQLAMQYGVLHFTLISTDKAVRPTNVMGATKRIAELSIHLAQKQAVAQAARIRYSIVRFGNVLGSSGSVVPKFRAQIAAGGPITLTHPDITRYFMTIQEAAQLVIQAAAMSEETAQSRPDTYLLDMGESVRIQDLARAMIRLSGQQVRESKNDRAGIEIVYTGLRPGEKLYEELLISGASRNTVNAKIFQDLSECSHKLLDDLQTQLEQFASYSAYTIAPTQVLDILKRYVPEYTPDLRSA
jgi:FlaA1/EpsC-like NDP-sugar epimerase